MRNLAKQFILTCSLHSLLKVSSLECSKFTKNGKTRLIFLLKIDIYNSLKKDLAQDPIQTCLCLWISLNQIKSLQTYPLRFLWLLHAAVVLNHVCYWLHLFILDRCPQESIQLISTSKHARPCTQPCLSACVIGSSAFSSPQPQPHLHVRAYVYLIL